MLNWRVLMKKHLQKTKKSLAVKPALRILSARDGAAR